MRLRLLPLLGALLVLSAAGARGQQRELRHPDFTASCIGFRDSLGQSAAEVRMEIAPSELSFVKADSGYRAEVDIGVTILDEHDDQVSGDIWRRVVDLKRYDELSRLDPILRERRILPAKPGKLRVRIELHDINSDATSSMDLPLESVGGDAKKPTLSMSSLQIGPLVDSAGPPHRGSVEDELRKTFGNPLPRLACYGEIYAGPGSPDSVELRGELLDETGRSYESSHWMLHLSGGAATYLYRPNFDKLGVGTYVIRMQARWGKQKSQREERFEMDETRIVFDDHFDELLDVLALVAEPGELDSLRKAPPDERARRWEAFWERHNPSPETGGNPAAREFFKRMRYANSHFGGASAGPGWRTDMGRTYIKYGAPDRTESHAQTAHDYATEIWYYDEPHSMTFVFVDRGFGRFELISQRGS